MTNTFYIYIYLFAKYVMVNIDCHFKECLVSRMKTFCSHERFKQNYTGNIYLCHKLECVEKTVVATGRVIKTQCMRNRWRNWGFNPGRWVTGKTGEWPLNICRVVTERKLKSVLFEPEGTTRIRTTIKWKVLFQHREILWSTLEVFNS